MTLWRWRSATSERVLHLLPPLAVPGRTVDISSSTVTVLLFSCSGYSPVICSRLLFIWSILLYMGGMWGHVPKWGGGGMLPGSIGVLRVACPWVRSRAPPAQNPPSSKFDIFLEAVGHAYVPLYTRSEAYLAPNGTYISVGPIPDGLSETLSLLWNVYMRPKWAGGTNRQFKYVLDSPRSSSFHAEGRVSVQQTIQREDHRGVVD